MSDKSINTLITNNPMELDNRVQMDSWTVKHDMCMALSDAISD